MASQGKKEILRNSARINLEIQAAVSITPPGKRFSEMVSVSIKSLGGGGIMIISPILLREGSLVKTTLFFQSSEISFMAEVVWTDKKSGKKEQKEFRMGLKFRSISDNDLLYIQNFVLKQLQISPQPAI
ncbi:MAG: PilZ domain-containing protein [Nitrospiria bacterium]